MKKTSIFGLVSVLALSFGGTITMPATAAGEAQVAAAAQVGQPAPAFTLTDSNGKQHSLAQYKGKFVVLEWVNFGCPFVKKHYNSGNMQGLQEKYTNKGVIWLSINSSAPGKQGNFSPAEINQRLIEKKSKATAYLIDENGAVGRTYGAKATPHMFAIDKKGTLIYQGAIDDKNTTDIEDIKTAKNYVSAALDEALAGKQIATASTTAYGCSVKY
jgi:peroxiredoxin